MTPDSSHHAATRRLSPVAVALLLVGAAAPAPAADWKYDVVVLKEGKTAVKGLLVNYSETAPVVRLRVLVQKPGVPSRIENHFYKRSEIDAVEPLDARERTRLEERFQSLNVSNEELA